MISKKLDITSRYDLQNNYLGKKLKDLIKQIRGIKMDGIRTAREILRIDRNANIIGLTAYADSEWGRRLLEVGAKEIFDKKEGFEKFVKRVRELLTNHYIFFLYYSYAKNSY